MKTILVTRPAPGGHALCEAIDAAGGHSIYFPTMEIHPIEKPLKKVGACDIIIFTSPNAVIHANDLLPLANQASVATVGAGTVNTLKQYDITTHICPETQFNSEGLLALPEMQGIKNKDIIIITGIGGRSLLEDTLRTRGANVSTIPVYTRELPDVSPNDVDELLQSNRIDIIVCTSCECLENLTVLAKDHIDLLRQHQLLVSSERIASLAESLQFQHKAILTLNAQNETIVASLFSE